MDKIELLLKLGLQLSSVDMKKIDLDKMVRGRWGVNLGISVPKIEILVKLGFQPSSDQLKKIIVGNASKNISPVLIDPCINYQPSHF
jgi:hypothetical protein